ncbi:MAG: Stp1/IreP family PP2C-type Ser/Thr phosphatase [Bradymonadia bacterium]
MTAPGVCRFGVVTDVGRVRDHNEDAWMAMPRGGVFVVADGMGGHASGEVASQLAVEAVRNQFETRPTFNTQQGQGSWVTQSALYLADAVRIANQEILASARVRPDYEGMGTTVVAIWVHQHIAHVAHVGDSRVYHLRGGRLTQITWDHSLVNEYLRLGVLQPHEASSFPYKNVIVRALGLSPNVAVDVEQVDLMPGDRFLLCTDGLTDLVSDESIRQRLITCRRPNVAARVLTEDALAAGGHDNITAMVVDVLEGESR